MKATVHFYEWSAVVDAINKVGGVASVFLIDDNWKVFRPGSEEEDAAIRANKARCIGTFTADSERLLHDMQEEKAEVLRERAGAN